MTDLPISDSERKTRIGQQEIDSNSSQRDLADSQIEELAQVIVSKYMATIAITYLGLLSEMVENLRSIRQGRLHGLQQDVLND